MDLDGLGFAPVSRQCGDMVGMAALDVGRDPAASLPLPRSADEQVDHPAKPTHSVAVVPADLAADPRDGRKGPGSGVCYDVCTRGS